MSALGGLLLRTAFGCLIAAILLFVWAVAFTRTELLSALSPEFPVWLLWIAGFLFPAVLASVLAARAAARAGRLALAAAIPFAAGGGALLFVLYMRWLSPAVAWDRGWILPVVASLVALAPDLFRRRGQQAA